MRIIAGKHKGRRIELKKEAAGSGVRPTSEFAREAVFNILNHSKHSDGVTGKSALDVFCGTGAYGLEALSRGAASATFIDNSRDALQSAHDNAERMNELDQSDFIQSDATRLPRARQSYDLIFIDPPYFRKLLPPSLASLVAGGWLNQDSLIIMEHDSKELVELPPELVAVDERHYGRATIKLLKLHPAG